MWQVLKKKGYEKTVKEFQVIQHWPEIVGEKIAAETEPTDSENGCLFVKVANASWKNELVFLKPEIIKKVNDFTGNKVVKDIKFIR